MSVSLSRMNKPQLYEECKKLRQENMKLHLFQDENIMLENEKLINDVACLEDIIKNLKNKYEKEIHTPTK